MIHQDVYPSVVMRSASLVSKVASVLSVDAETNSDHVLNCSYRHGIS